MMLSDGGDKKAKNEKGEQGVSSAKDLSSRVSVRRARAVLLKAR